MKVKQFFLGVVCFILVCALLGGIAIFAIPSLQTDVLNKIAVHSQTYKDTCAELEEEKTKSNSLTNQLSIAINAKNSLQNQFDIMQSERDILLADANEKYVIYYIDSYINNDNLFRFYLNNFTNENVELTLAMYDVNDILTETFDWTLVNFPNPENTPNTVVDDDLNDLIDTYHIKFLDGNYVLSDFTSDDGSALNKSYSVYYEVYCKDTMFDTMVSRLDEREQIIEDLREQLFDSNTRITQLQQRIDNLNIEIENLRNNSGVNLTLTSSNYYIGVTNNDKFIGYLSKQIYSDNSVRYNSKLFDGATLLDIDNFNFNHIHTDDSYYVQVDGYTGTVNGSHFYYFPNQDVISTNYILRFIDSNGNDFDFSSISTSHYYNATPIQLEHICFDNSELENTEYYGQNNIIKEVIAVIRVEDAGSLDTGLTYTQYFDANVGGADAWTFVSDDNYFSITFMKDGSGIYNSNYNTYCYVYRYYDNYNGFETRTIAYGSVIYNGIEIINSTEIYYDGMHCYLQ